MSEENKPPADSALEASSFGEESPITPPGDDALSALRISEPTQEELDGLSVMERLDLLERRRRRREAEYDRQALDAELYRQSRRRRFKSIGIGFGAVFAALGLYAAGLATDTFQEDRRAFWESRITDQYARTIEALGSEDPLVRVGALHVLGRLMTASEGGQETITAVLAAYSLQHDPSPEKKLPDDAEPAPDLQAALNVLGQWSPSSDDAPGPDLHGLRAPRIRLNGVTLRGADLRGADLRGADLSGGTDLDGADLRGADLRGANLHDLFLHDADLRGADLRGANMNHTKVVRADLRGVDMRGTEMDESSISLLTSKTEGTKFGPLPTGEEGP